MSAATKQPAAAAAAAAAAARQTIHWLRKEAPVSEQDICHVNIFQANQIYT